MPLESRWSPVTAYQLGALAFTGGTGLWGASDLLGRGTVDPAMVAYAVGCLYFLEDAFRPVFAPAPSIGGRLWLGLNSYQLGSIAYGLGTAVWSIESYMASHRLDPVAIIYGVGCAWFLRDAFAASTPHRRWRLTDAQLGSVAFLVGTVVWGATSGWSWTVASYGLGCLFFLRHVFSGTTATAGSE
jgi:hypothetical protein